VKALTPSALKVGAAICRYQNKLKIVGAEMGGISAVYKKCHKHKLDSQ